MVDVAVDIEEYTPAVLALVCKGGKLANSQQVGKMEEKEGIFITQTLGGVYFTAD
jgi:hypothetical protein